MMRKILHFRNLVDNIPKNIGLYLVGVMFLILYSPAFEVAPILLSLIAFLISYSSIYILNDLYDVSEDAMDNEKALRKPLALGTLERSEAIKMFAVFLILGLALSLFINMLFFLVVNALLLINVLYSVPLLSRKNNISKLSGVEHASEQEQYISLKHTGIGLPLVLVMQLLKIFLPWTTGSDLARFPIMFALAFSIFYATLFKGYKARMTIGDSIKNEPILIAAAALAFIISMFVHQEQLLQAAITLYLLMGVVIFWSSRLTDRKVLIMSPIYIVLGVFGLLYVVIFS